MAKDSKAPTIPDPFGPAPAVVQAQLRTYFPGLLPAELDKLKDFYADLQSTNRTISLVSGSAILNPDSGLFYDSISAARLIYPQLNPGKKVFEVSNTVGFPGVILSILYPTLAVEIVERDSRKVEFLKRVITKCALSNLVLLNSDFDHLAVSSIHNAVLRGPMPLTKTLLTGRKQTAKGGKLFHMKGDTWSGELSSVPAQLFSVWSPKLVGSYKLPLDKSNMNVVVTQKIVE